MINFSLSEQELKNLIAILKEVERIYQKKTDAISVEKLFQLRNILVRLERKFLEL